MKNRFSFTKKTVFAVRARTGVVLFALSGATLSGCSGVKPVTGGTTGTLSFGNGVFSDLQVTVHRIEGAASEILGFGVTDTKGTFMLMTNGAHGPLWLSPGEYRFTLESAGAPVQIPKEFTRPESTPLKVSWPTSEEKLNLETSISIRAR